MVPQYESAKNGKFPEQNGLKGMQMVQFECPGHSHPFCLIHLGNWENSPFSILALWGNKNWPPSINMEQIENYLNKMGLMGSKWSSLNAPGTQTPLSHSVLKFANWPFSIIGSLG